MKDEDLLKFYMKGFNDELNGVISIDSDDELIVRAYYLGADHAILGDDCRSFDYITDKEILKMIKL